MGFPFEDRSFPNPFGKVKENRANPVYIKPMRQGPPFFPSEKVTCCISNEPLSLSSPASSTRMQLPVYGDIFWATNLMGEDSFPVTILASRRDAEKNRWKSRRNLHSEFSVTSQAQLWIENDPAFYEALAIPFTSFWILFAKPCQPCIIQRSVWIWTLCLNLNQIIWYITRSDWHMKITYFRLQ